MNGILQHIGEVYAGIFEQLARVVQRGRDPLPPPT